MTSDLRTRVEAVAAQFESCCQYPDTAAVPA